jgi:methyl-accepting chemotaxis protein
MKKARNYLLIASISVLVLLIAGFILAGIFNVLLQVLYICLMVLAAFSLISTLLLIYLLLSLIRTFTTVRNEMKPLIESVNQTVTSVRGSVEETLTSVKDTAKSAGQTASVIRATAGMTNKAVGPTVRVAALLVASREAVRIFFGKGHTRKRYEERRERQQELLNAAGGGE